MATRAPAATAAAWSPTPAHRLSSGRPWRRPSSPEGFTSIPRSTDVLADFARITTAASTGDPAARTLIEQSAHYLGHAAVTLTNLFDLDVIVLAGPSFGPAVAMYREVIQAELDQRWFSRRAHPVRVLPSANGDDAAAIGGAVLVLQNELTWPT